MALKIALLMLALASILAAPALAQDATPPAVKSDDLAGLSQSVSALGYPRLGDDRAPVNVVEYCALDSPACARFRADVLPDLLPLIADGRVVYTFIPLYGLGDTTNARTAARAAVCAAEQGAFWPFSQALFDRLAANSATAFASEALAAAMTALDLDRARWDNCMLSERPDIVLETATTQAGMLPGFDGTSVPFVQVNGVPSLPDRAGLMAAIHLELQTLGTRAPEATPEATDEVVIVTVEPLLGQPIPPPVELELPAGWRYGYDALVLSDVDNAIRSIPLAVYTGPVSGGRGVIVLLWGFPNLVAGNPFTGGSAPDLWSDGLRLLRLAVIEQGCNIGTDLRMSYSVGDLPASGTQFSAVDCPQLPDTRGWFAGLQEGGINFVFYVYTEPISAMNTAGDELQLILDSARFTVPTPAATTATPEPGAGATPAPRP